MFGIGIPEFILILIVGLIVFGPSKLPEIGRSVGKCLREFRKASNAMQAIINAPEEPPVPKPASAAGKEETVKPTVSSGEASSGEVEAKPSPGGYEPPTQESVRTQIEEQQKNS